MRNAFIGAALALGCWLMGGGIAKAQTSAQAPVLVELFTSEGCSSCPPADALLAQIARERRDVVVLSEHVDYWNSLGWKDPYSSGESTSRQEAYARTLGGDGPYTPQMVVNGQRGFVGSDRGALAAALVGTARETPVALELKSEAGGDGDVRAQVHLAAAPAGGALVAVLVENEGTQQVTRGENGGRTLHHVSMARGFSTLARVARGAGFDGEAKFALPAGARAAGYHLVVFLQVGAGGPVVAVAST